MTSSLLLVSDFDGCLVDTEAAVRAAYEEAYGFEFSDHNWQNYWGQPWHTWCDAQVKKRKDELYPRHVDKVKLTTFGTHFFWNDYVVLTGASRRSVELVTSAVWKDAEGRYPFTNIPVLGCERSYSQKQYTLKALRPANDMAQPPAAYFDDNREAGLFICSDTRFVFCHVMDDTIAIHIPDTLTTEEGEEAWTVLSSQLALMNVCRG